MARWSRVFSFSADGYSADLGLTAGLLRWLSLGLASNNLLSGSGPGSGADPSPTTVRFGASAGALALGRAALSGHGSLVWLPDAARAGIGVAGEASVVRLVSLRAGYSRQPASFGDPLAGWAFGLGVRIGGLTLDVARRPGSRSRPGGSTYVSLTLQPSSSHAAP